MRPSPRWSPRPTADFFRDDVRDALAASLVSPIRWTAVLAKLERSGCDALPRRRARARCSPGSSAGRWPIRRSRSSRTGSRPLPELSPGQQWEVDSSLVDPEGLVARATGAATNGAKRTAGPGIAAVAASLPERVVENEELAGPLGRRPGVDLLANRNPSPPPRERREPGRSGGRGRVACARSRRFRCRRSRPGHGRHLHPGPACCRTRRRWSRADWEPRRRGPFDVGAACTGFLSALSLATAQIESGRARTVLVVGAEVLSAGDRLLRPANGGPLRRWGGGRTASLWAAPA